MSFEELIIDMCRSERLPLARVEADFFRIDLIDERDHAQHPVFLHPVKGHGGILLLEAYTIFFSPADVLSKQQLNFLLHTSTTFSAGEFAIVETPNSSMVIYRFRIPLHQLDAPAFTRIIAAVATCGNEMKIIFNEVN